VGEADIELAGAAVGAVPAGRKPILGEQLKPGDEIVLVASAGLHANGASLARLLAERLPEGYATALPSGRKFGQALLDASAMYVALVQALLDAAVPVTYLSHITGHGLLKLMRSPRQLTYRITGLPPVPEVLAFMVEQLRMDDRAAYSTLNMGAGYAVYCAAGTGSRVVELASAAGLQALVAGAVEDGPRRVILDPLGIEYAGAELEFTELQDAT
jgi:phosphoribosylformylglycinamidine cyclo-ligase